MRTTLLKKLMVVAVGGLFVASAASTELAGQRGAGGQAGAPAAPAARGGRGGGGIPQGGRGPIKVMVVTKGHTYDREPFFQMWDSWGSDITWSHVEHPAADVMLSPKYSKLFDVYAFFDIGGAGIGPARQGQPAPVVPPGSFKTANNRFYPPPSEQLKTEFPKLLREGKGFVFLHHASAAWAHTWPEYSEVIGGACDWYAPQRIRGIDNPNHGYFGMTPQFISFVDKTHPITKGLGDGFHVTDEAYACHWFEDSVIPLARTDFQPLDPTKNLNPKVKYSNLAAWVKTAENSPVFFTQVGHGVTAWATPAYRQLVGNAIKWAASPEALAWAKANPKRIFNSSN
jgi:type 1 glutamine amidotransferase